MTDILIVEDDKELAGLLTDFLRDEGYITSSVDSGERAVQLFEQYGARLVVLDINLPDVNGFAVCSKLRENADTPILIVSSRTGKEDKLNGFDLGADDYIEKPYDIDILIAKIKRIFKRRYQRDTLSADGVTLNLADKTAAIDGKPVELPAKEFDLLALLLENQGKSLKKSTCSTLSGAATAIRNCKRYMCISTVSARSSVIILRMQSVCLLSGVWGISLYEGFQKIVYCSDNCISFINGGIEYISCGSERQ